MNRYVLGFGCERGLSKESLEKGLKQFLRNHGLSVSELQSIATIDLKEDETALRKLAREKNLPLVFFDSDTLKEIDPPNPNPRVKEAVGVCGVAEPAALLAGQVDRLAREKTVLRPGDRAMTFALAPVE